MAHDIRCDEEFTWSEDMLLNLSYIRYAKAFMPSAPRCIITPATASIRSALRSIRRRW